MRENPKVCLEVEEIEDKGSWTTVVVFGRYEEIHQSSERERSRVRAEQLFAARSDGGCPRRRKFRGATPMKWWSVGSRSTG